jgi:hypothetical protein
MKLKILTFIILFNFLLNNPTFASKNGGYAGSFLRMGVGARSNALGNAGVADRPNGYSFYYNPSAASFVDGKIIALSYSFMSLDRRFNVISYSMQVPPEAGLSIALVNTGVGDITAYNSLGEEAGSIEQWANGIYFNFAKRFNGKFSLGLSLKYLREDINHKEYDYNASGWGFDIGGTYLLTDHITIAGAMRDIRSKLKANTSDIFEFGGTTVDEFPLIYNLGFRYITPYSWLRILYDFEGSTQEAYRNHFGVEIVYIEGDMNAVGDNLSLCLGLNEGEITAGAGMVFNFLGNSSRLDYAFIPSYIDEGSSHIFSWQFFLK